MDDKKDQQQSFSEIEYKGNMFREFLELIMKNKKYWMLPLILVILLLALLIIFGETVATPFIYTLF